MSEIDRIWFTDEPCLVIKGNFVYTYTDDGVYGVPIQEVVDYIYRDGNLIEE